MGIMGFGVVCVIGRTLVPLPAARIIAFIGSVHPPSVGQA
jgi:hypothetical protein